MTDDPGFRRETHSTVEDPGVSANPNTEREEPVFQPGDPEHTLAVLVGAVTGLAAGSEQVEALLTRNGVPLNKAEDALHAILADRDLLARALRLASEEIAWRRYDEAVGESETPEEIQAELLREAGGT